MAKVLKVTDGTTTVDFVSGDLVLEFQGFQIESLNDADWEVISLVSGASDANIRTALANLDKLREQAILYASDPQREKPVWFYWQSEGESVKRSLVLDMTIKVKSQAAITPVLGRGGVAADLAIKHDAAWESDTLSTDSDTGISAFGGTWSPSLNVGTLPSRISSFLIETSVASGPGDIFVGIKDTRKGNAGFTALFEAEYAGDLFSVTPTSDANASAGNFERCDFTTNPEMHYRISWALQDVIGSNWDDMIGKYLVLARMKLDVYTTKVRVQFRHGWSYLTGDEGEISANIFFDGTIDPTPTTWKFFELGEIRIPTTGNRLDFASDGNLIKYYGLSIYAERLSASGYLDVDCIVLLPTDHMIACKGADLSYASGNPTGTLEFMTGEDGFKSIINRQYTLGSLDDINNAITDPEFRDWDYPIEGGIVVVCGRDAAVGDTLDSTIKTYPRWRGFRA